MTDPRDSSPRPRPHGVVPASAIVTLALLVAMPTALAAAPATASPSLGLSGSLGGSSWAYGAFKSVNASGTGTDANGSFGYALHAYYGFETQLTQINVSSTVTELTINRTLAANFYGLVCRPGCSDPFVTVNLTYKALEQGHGAANFTNEGIVYEPSGAVPAEALVNTSDAVHASISVAVAGTLHGLLGTRSASSTFNAAANGTVAASFDPALGLYPLALSEGTTWSSIANFSATGMWALEYSGAKTTFAGVSTTFHQNLSGANNRSGTVALAGIDRGSFTLGDATSADAVELTSIGPYAIREGILFVPDGADLLGPGNQATFATLQGGSETADTSAVDFHPMSDGHSGPVSAATVFSSTSSTDEAPSSASTTVSAMAQSTNGGSTGPVIVQAQPQSTATAQQWSDCLASGDCPAGGTTTSVRGSLIGAIVVIVVAVVLVGLVVARRRDLPAAPRPHATLYPANPGASERPASRPGTAPAPPSDETADPLANLW